MALARGHVGRAGKALASCPLPARPCTSCASATSARDRRPQPLQIGLPIVLGPRLPSAGTGLTSPLTPDSSARPASRRIRHGSSQMVVCAVQSEESAATAAEPAAAGTGPLVSTSAVWELDFCSRPILDERGKKVWELLICDPDRKFLYSEYFPNNKINSVSLRETLGRILEQEGVARPQKIRFFRAQMQTIISKALSDLGIQAVPSRRCAALIGWLQERMQTVYPQMSGYTPSATPLLSLTPPDPQDLPDALKGENWEFVQLPLSGLAEDVAAVNRGSMFGQTLSFERLVDELGADALVPGLAVFSRRALPLAAWTNGLELAHLAVEVDRRCVVMETGVSDRWRYASWRAGSEDRVALDWERAKKEAGGVHFLAIQTDPEADSCTGLWLLKEIEPSLI